MKWIVASAAVALVAGGCGSDLAVSTAVVSTPDGTVPSVFAHTQESVTDLLAEHGLQVRFGEQDSCEQAGRPVRTEPATGTPVEEGDTVTVLLSFQGPTTDCVSGFDESWQFVDFATSRGPAPEFADTVALFVDGEPTGTLSGTEAAHGDWGAGSALDLLARATEQVMRTGDTYLTPSLRETVGTPPDSWCGVVRPEAVGDREALSVAVDFQGEGVWKRCAAQVALYRTDGAIDTVVAWSEADDDGTPESIPDVVGLSLAEARSRVTAAGYPARVEEHETCHPRSGVVEQAPTQQAVNEDRGDEPDWFGPVTLVVEVPHTTRDCAGLDAAAAGFLRFTRGGAAPTWAPEVQQLLGYTPWATVSAARADDPGAWSSVVAAMGGADVEAGEDADVTRWPDGEYCELIDRGGLPSLLADEQRIALYPAAVNSCKDDWEVWIWIDDAGRIAAVNLLVPSGD